MGALMFDAKKEYQRIFTARADFIRSGEKNEGLLQAYDSLLNVLSNHVNFRAKTFIELSQPKEEDRENKPDTLRTNSLWEIQES